MKILHLISGLGSGGAENTLYKIVTNDLENIHIIISLKKGGVFKKKLKNNNILTYTLNFKLSFIVFFEFIKLISIIRKIKPDLIQSWMYKCNFITIFIKFFFRLDVYWNIRASFYKKLYSPYSKIMIYVSALTSHIIPKKIIYCSYESIINHEKIFFSKKKSIFIANGFDVIRKINFEKDIKILNNYKFNKENIVFCMIARFDPHKNHLGLLNNFVNIIKKNKSVKLILIGKNVNSTNGNLYRIIKNNNLSQNIVLLDQMNNLEQIYPIIDFHILLSFSESFPNVIAETMSRGIPNISSNVGHASEIINNYGWIINNDNNFEFKKAINDAINIRNNKDDFLKLKYNCIKSISDNYNLKNMIKNYHKVWNKNND
jgi:glycosyltransferase involved in cell wall biosynthesis